MRVIRLGEARRELLLEVHEVAQVEHTVGREIPRGLLVLEKIQVRVVAWVLRVGAAGRVTRMTARQRGDVIALYGYLAGRLGGELVCACRTCVGGT